MSERTASSTTTTLYIEGSDHEIFSYDPDEIWEPISPPSSPAGELDREAYVEEVADRAESVASDPDLPTTEVDRVYLFESPLQTFEDFPEPDGTWPILLPHMERKSPKVILDNPPLDETWKELRAMVLPDRDEDSD